MSTSANANPCSDTDCALAPRPESPHLALHVTVSMHSMELACPRDTKLLRVAGMEVGFSPTAALAEALFGRLMGTLEFGLSSSDDEVMGASVDALAVLARHHIAALEAGRQGLRPTAPTGAAHDSRHESLCCSCDPRHALEWSLHVYYGVDNVVRMTEGAPIDRAWF